MGISSQFSGLPMEQLIGAPLTAASDASIKLANSTADFINKVGFDNNGNVRNVAFKYEKFSKNDDGSMNLDAMKIDVPMLAIVPIPNLQVDEVNILFDMEVKESEKSESSLDIGASINGQANFGIVKVSVTGSVSVHQANTRSTDNSAKYHVDVRAANHGTPEGLARVLDMMAANVSPSLIGSTLKDENGQDLSGAAKIRAEKLKSLRAEISAIEKKINANKSSLSTSIIDFKRQASSQLEEYRMVINTAIRGNDNSLGEEDSNEEKANEEGYTGTIEQLEQTWASAMNLLESNIKTIAESGVKGNSLEETDDEVYTIFGFKGLNSDFTIDSNYSKNEANNHNSKYDAILISQNNAIEKMNALIQAENELIAKKQEYDEAIAK